MHDGGGELHHAFATSATGTSSSSRSNNSCYSPPLIASWPMPANLRVQSLLSSYHHRRVGSKSTRGSITISSNILNSAGENWAALSHTETSSEDI